MLLRLLTLTALLSLQNLSWAKPSKFKSNQRLTINSPVVQIPLERFGNLFFLWMTVDGNSHKFMLDLGAQDVVFDARYFPGYDYYPIEFSSINQATIAGGKMSVESLEFDGVSFTNRNVYIMPMHHAQKLINYPFSGVVGVNLFEDFEIELDLLNSKLVLYQTNERGERLSESNSQFVSPNSYSLPFSYTNGILILEGTMNGQSVKFGLDTGAEVTVLDSRMKRKVRQSVDLFAQARAVGVGGQIKIVEAGQIPALHFYEVVKVEYLQTIVLPLAHVEDAYGASLDGLLGYDFFAKASFVINFKKREILVNPHEDQWFFCDPVEV